MTIEETAWIYILSYSGALGLILLGIIGMVISRHLIRIILGLMLLEAGVNLFLITIGYRANGVAPILVDGQVPAAIMVDPIPQALVLTAIVIGVAVQALALALVVKTWILKNWQRKLPKKVGRASLMAYPSPYPYPLLDNSWRKNQHECYLVSRFTITRRISIAYYIPSKHDAGLLDRPLHIACQSRNRF